MRLVCPNCGAQYEVPAEAIPPAGRDVQCSACGQTWFEGGAGGARPGGPAGARPGDEDGAEEDLAWAEPEDVPRSEDDEEERDDLAELAWEPSPGDGPEPGSREPRRREPEGRAEDEDPDGLDESPPAPGLVRSTVTPEIAEILREEAEREARARAEEARQAEAADRAEAARAAEEARRIEAEAEARSRREIAEQGRWPDPIAAEASPPASAAGWAPEPESEPEGEPEPQPGADPRWAAPGEPVRPDRDRQRAEEARRRMARLRGEAAAVAPPARRDRLPDIEEIDSSLRGASRAASSAATAPASGRGFRLGFGGALLVAALLALLYAYAPRITAAVPALSPVLDPYAAAIDRGRLWLDARMRGMVEDLGGTNATPPSSIAPASEAPEVQAEPPAAPATTAPAATGG